jgi:hypothetical protein
MVGWNFVAGHIVALTKMSHCSELAMLMSHCNKMSHIVLMSHCSKLDKMSHCSKLWELI